MRPQLASSFMTERSSIGHSQVWWITVERGKRCYQAIQSLLECLWWTENCAITSASVTIEWTRTINFVLSSVKLRFARDIMFEYGISSEFASQPTYSTFRYGNRNFAAVRRPSIAVCTNDTGQKLLTIELTRILLCKLLTKAIPSQSMILSR